MKRHRRYRYKGQPKDIAYINAMNEILPTKNGYLWFIESLVNSHVGAVKVSFRTDSARRRCEKRR